MTFEADFRAITKKHGQRMLKKVTFKNKSDPSLNFSLEFQKLLPFEIAMRKGFAEQQKRWGYLPDEWVMDDQPEEETREEIIADMKKSRGK